MGCICSKSTHEEDYSVENSVEEKQKGSNKVVVQLVAPLPIDDEVKLGASNLKSLEGSNHNRSKTHIDFNINPAHPGHVDDHNGKTRIIERPKDGHQRRSTMDLGGVSKIVSLPHGGACADQVAAGWPTWLASVAPEAIQGWTPRRADSYEKICKIGQGTYSTVYRARDLLTDKIVAMKKVRFVNMDPESVRFMAREISILRKLDHPNVMKLDAIVTSRISGSLYLVFEYMEHDLSGLLASPNVKFTEQQIKCYMQQLFRGLEHCHNRGILHRDIKGSNLLVDNKGVLKIGDFGLATNYEPEQKQPLTSRVVTLWYRAPELLLGATEYGVAIDMWSAGCIVAELFAGKPIMPGRTEVEQMHKIFKLCGSPTEEFWRKTYFPHATSFKSQRIYKRRVAETFKDFPSSALDLVETLLSINPDQRGTASSALKSKFFTSKPLPCEPSSIPRYPPSKELEVKMREDEARRRKAESVKDHTGGYGANNSKKSKAKAEVAQSNKCTSEKYKPLEDDGGTGFPIEPPRVERKGYTHSNSVVHPNAAVYSYNKRVKNDGSNSVLPRTMSTSSQHGSGYARQGSHFRTTLAGSSNHRSSGNDQVPNNDATGYVPKRNRILCSGPLVPPGGNMEDMLKEHERQIQEAVRKARIDKTRKK